MSRLPEARHALRPASRAVAVLVGALAAALAAALLAGCGIAASPAPSQPLPGGSALPSAGTPSAGPESALPLVVDTDVAPDDITAIASLLRDPAVDLRAITVVGTGEAHCAGGMFVVRSILTMLDRQLPVTCGNGSPLGPAEEFPAAWRAGADSGNGLALVSPSFVPDARPAPQLIAELAAAEASAGRRLTILTLGTLTNVATALEVDPELPSKVRLVSMLGAVDVPGNVTSVTSTPVAEWNAHADPTAVRRVLDAGFDWTLVPLDATNTVPMTPDVLTELERDHAAGPADVVFELWARNPYMTQGGTYLWDPLAAVVVREPGVMPTRTARLTVVEGDGPDGGRLVEDPAGPPVVIGTSADGEAALRVLFERLRLGPPRADPFTPVGDVVVSGGDGACTATLDPATPPAGLLRVRAVNRGTDPMSAIVFELGDVSWPEIETFVADFDPASQPPPVTVVAQVSLDGAGEASGYGVTPAGELGVVCATGPFEAPAVLLTGPFPVGP